MIELHNGERHHVPVPDQCAHELVRQVGRGIYVLPSGGYLFAPGTIARVIESDPYRTRDEAATLVGELVKVAVRAEQS